MGYWSTWQYLCCVVWQDGPVLFCYAVAFYFAFVSNFLFSDFYWLDLFLLLYVCFLLKHSDIPALFLSQSPTISHKFLLSRHLSAFQLFVLLQTLSLLMISSSYYFLSLVSHNFASVSLRIDMYVYLHICVCLRALTEFCILWWHWVP
jgi:hypothetical protein